MKRIKQSLLAAIALMTVLFTSCNNGDSEPQPDMFMMFATLENIGDGSCTFSVQENNDKAPVLLTASVTLNKDNFKEGSRYLIQYSTPDNNPFTAGSITLYAVFGVFEGEVTETTMEEISPLMGDPINVVYCNLIGNWLDIQSVAPLSARPEVFGVYVDETTLGSEYPSVYLGFKSDNTGAMGQMTFYASFDMSLILELKTAKGFNFHYRYNGMNQSKVFEKTNKDISQM